MSSGGNKGGVQSDINVTPLIDVLLVLLIIFLVVMPIMMKMETLQVPRKIDENIEQVDAPLGMLTLTVKADLSIEFTDGLSENPTIIQAGDIQRVLKPKLEAMASAGQLKVVFVDFEKTIPWREVVSTMDTVRALAADINHDDVKVALKVKDDAPATPAQ
jgi:biopolymer transport protein ExbD